MPSPTPANFTGTPSSREMATAMPPLAVPSSFVRMMPVRPAVSLKFRAWMRPFCPVEASSTSRVSRAAPGHSRSMILESFASSAMRLALLWSRPAVSQMTTSTCRALAACRASKSTAPGSAPSYWRTIWQSARSAQISSWSAAAARKVSAAQRRTLFPSCRRRWAILPMEVVFPTPLTPTTKMTEGFVERSMAVSSSRICRARMSRRASFSCSSPRRR